MPYISGKNNLLLNHRQCKKDLLRCLKVAEAQGQIPTVSWHIPCSNSENSSSSRFSASKQKVRLVGEKKPTKNKTEKA